MYIFNFCEKHPLIGSVHISFHFGIILCYAGIYRHAAAAAVYVYVRFVIRAIWFFLRLLFFSLHSKSINYNNYLIGGVAVAERLNRFEMWIIQSSGATIKKSISVYLDDIISFDVSI